jgi:tricorn protease
MGLRSPDGKGAQEDIFIAHLTQEAFDTFKLARSGAAVMPPAKAKEASQKTGDWQPQTDGIRHRLTRLTPISLGNVLYLKVFPEGRELLVLTSDAMGQLLGYRVGLTSESFKQIFARKLTAVSVSMDDRGEALYAISPAGIERISLADGSSRMIPYEAKLDYDPRGEMAWLFQHFWRLTKLKFYEPTLHGRDWQGLRESYVKFLPSLQQWEDFCDLMGEMAGELNASHMGCFWLHKPPLADDTASLGIYEDNGYAGPGVRVQEVLVGGPCDLAAKPIKPGAIITAVDGLPVQHIEHLHALLNRKAGTPIELSMKADTGAASRVIVSPVNFEAAKALAVDHWVAQRRAMTTTLSGGRLGYLYISEMDASNYQRAVDYIFGEGRDKEALVIDIRFNGGGLLHDQLATLFTGDVTADFISRDGFHAGRIPVDRWGKPSILMANASSYSDGSIFPHLYQRLKIGPVVGTRVPGTGTAVWWMSKLNGSIQYGIPQLGAKDRQTGWFENNETVPDILITNSPDDIAAGRDPQLEAAVQRLLQDLAAGKKEK